MTIAEKIHNETEYGCKPDMDAIKDAHGRESVTKDDRWVCTFPDGSALIEHPTFGVVVA